MRDNHLFKALDRWGGIPAVWVGSLIRRLSSSWSRGAIPLHRIIVIKLSALGDTILLLPALAGLRRALPNVSIDLLVTDINRAAAVAAPVDRTIVFNPTDLLNPVRAMRFLSLLRTVRYDVAIDADQWLRVSALLAAATGAPVLIGFKTAGQGKHFLFDHAVPHRRDRHEVRCFLDLFRTVGVTEESPRLVPLHTVTDTASVHEILRNYDIREPFCVIHPEVPGHAYQRSWPLERFAELAHRISTSTDLCVVVPVSARGVPQAYEIKRLAGGSPIVVSGLSLGTLSALLARARFAICCNTGFMHLAAAAGTRVIGLHGPTDATRWGPWGTGNIALRSPEPCSPCLYLGFEYGCPDNRCMRAISVDSVLNVALHDGATPNFSQLEFFDVGTPHL